jgi:hypothetical protein
MRQHPEIMVLSAGVETLTRDSPQSAWQESVAGLSVVVEPTQGPSLLALRKLFRRRPLVSC